MVEPRSPAALDVGHPITQNFVLPPLEDGSVDAWASVAAAGSAVTSLGLLLNRARRLAELRRFVKDLLAPRLPPHMDVFLGER